MANDQTIRQVPGLYRRRVGDFVVTAVNDGIVPIPAEVMVGMAPEEVQKALASRFRPADPHVTIGTYLVEHGGSRTLVDTGSRNLMGPTLGKLLKNLAVLGVIPDQIDRIALTHLHPDHAGGMLDDEGKAVFPRAEVFISLDEEKYWLGGEPPTDALGISAQVNSYASQLRKVYGDRWHAIGEEEVIPGMRREALPGHTPGHSGYHISSGTDELLIWGDITHVPVVQIAHPEVGLAFDVDVEQGRATRRRILDRISADRLAIGGMHLEFPGFGHVVRNSSGYEYVPDLWMPEI
ncbi:MULTISPECIES: MBL fold metallo-hydrolase [Alphaproteobacteria]|jgi:glyoxylase-like metal-dependent hydrolase (beta-lactamase superfamily II)|uniref:MBL fold metallo-hydrolase n=2 Tax=Alphaproteobacteria TaxID=28211 RepID=A0A512HNF2_9HYPH|nr:MULTISPECIES: MBL fold metallo-hydrolase [Alphaproteobacteria]GEO86987.1 MBL fold metallo-hydrolase [Ciceribacter naphthalenivorans]GLR23329.1 MBL fold metallo-hydrolase [Ciceribacter naphthalenivorans]GLT06185.1 MBL fold metallo-hydrolase [Sphingomonas psychrolutea]